MTCLMHDICNPPFGHFGEYAIGEWFERNLDGLFTADVTPGQGDAELRKRTLVDLKHFEGNAQAVRLVVPMQRLKLPYTHTAEQLHYLRPAYKAKPPPGTPHTPKRPRG